MSDQHAGVPRSNLFNVRLWSEDMGDGRKVMRGEARHVLSGGVCYFQEWRELVMYLAETMRVLDQSPEGGDAEARDLPQDGT